MSRVSWQESQDHSQMPQVPRAIGDRLGAVRRRIRRYLWIQGLGAVVVAAVVGFWLALALDYLPTRLGFPEMPRSARAVQLAVVAVVLAGVAWRAWIRPLRVPLTGASLALIVERFAPAFQNTLVTTVQLAERRRAVPAVTYQLWQEAARRAEDRLSGLVTAELLNRRRLRKVVAAAGIALATLLVLALARPEMFRLAVERLVGLSNRPWPRHAFIEVLGFAGGERKVAVGGDLVIRVRADARRKTPPPESCQIRYETTQGNRGRATMSRDGQERDGYQYYIFRGKPFQAIRGSIRFYVVGRDYRTDPHRVIAVQPPQLRELDVVYVPPEYTGLLRRRQRYHPGVAVPSRSEVALIGRATKHLQQLEISGLPLSDNGDRTASIQSDATRFSIPLGNLDQDLHFDLTLVDHDGIRSRQAYSVHLQARADQVPTVELRLTGIGSAVTPDARLPFQGKIDDDYGLARAWFEVQRGEKRHEFPLEVPSSGDLEEPLDLRELRRIDPEPLVVEPGEVIQVTVCAEDACDLGGDRVGRNQTVQLDVVRPDQLLAMLEARELGLRQRLEQIVGELTDDRDSLVRLRDDLASELEPTAAWAANPAQSGENGQAPGEPPGQRPADGDAEPAAETPLGGPLPPEATDPAADDASAQAQAAADRQSLREVRVERAMQDAQRVEHEVLGLAAAFEEIQAELDNNRINSSARQERLEQAIIGPLRAIAGQEIRELQEALETLQEALATGNASAAMADEAVARSDALLARLKQILEGMLEMESYKDLLDLLRTIVQQQEDLLEQTKEQQKESLLEGLFSE